MAQTPPRMLSRGIPNKPKLASIKPGKKPNKTTTTATEKDKKAYGEPIGEPTVSPTNGKVMTKI